MWTGKQADKWMSGRSEMLIIKSKNPHTPYFATHIPFQLFNYVIHNSFFFVRLRDLFFTAKNTKNFIDEGFI